MLAIRTSRAFRRALTRSAAAAFLAFATGCNGTGGIPPIELEAAEIVAGYAADALDVFLDPADDAGALRSFHSSTAGAERRSELTDAWAANAHLHAVAPGLLRTNVFELAQRDGDWPADAGSLTDKVVFVDPVRDAVQAFLDGGER